MKLSDGVKTFSTFFEIIVLTDQEPRDAHNGSFHVLHIHEMRSKKCKWQFRGGLHLQKEKLLRETKRNMLNNESLTGLIYLLTHTECNLEPCLNLVLSRM